MSTPLLLLVAVGVALVVLGLVTAKRPEHAIADRDGYFDRWQVLHGGYDPRTATVWVRFWLTLVYRIGRPLAKRGVQPDVVTLSSVWIALAVFVPAAQGGHWPILAGWVLVASGLFDTLDGCVAVLEDRTTKWGYVLDSLVDRVNDVVYLVAVVSVGAPPVLAITCGVGFFLMEYARARAGNAGGDAVGRVTVGERPMRVIFLSASIHFGGVFVAHAHAVATVGLSVMTAFTAVGLAQLLVALRRQLLALPVAEPTAV
ncbi:MAG: CDP-diacylglycerol--glycerol-3-phosphate 3-phosphatidyltransferase [Frankiales bacterium]|nr:CDP-diacylglycerol--glycerol-3-phosphate 3-phosphatidyltransferase [Frankiales bacterium]